MKFKPNRYQRLTIYTICVLSLTIFPSIQLCKGSSVEEEEEEGNMRTLSRRRRYLIFPEGSSLQIVYDTYHPVVDYTNLLVVGITGSLAWELPSKPVYPERELNEMMYTKTNGSLPLLRRNDYGNMEVNNIQSENVEAELSSRNINYVSDKYQHYPRDYPPHMKAMKETNTRSNFNNDHSMNEEMLSRNYKLRHINSHHSIHPTFRKRNILRSTIEMSEDIHHSLLHRTSRYKLYERLEKFIDTTGYDGKDCILKALCETGQIERNENHRSFLGELMRAIFSLPDLEFRLMNTSEELYDAAYTKRGNCTTSYPKCSQHLWKSSFH